MCHALVHVVVFVGPEAADEGEIVDLEGRVLGRHKGLIHFTVGQRRGIEIGGSPEPLYVVRLDPAAKRLIVVKSSQHFYASFSQVGKHVIYVAAPGAVTLDLSTLPYRKIQRPKWPMDALPA